MFYTEIDKNGNIVLSQVVDASNLNGFILSNPDNHIVPDTPPNPPEYDPATQYAERQEPVLGDKVEYIIKQVPGAVKREPDPQIAADLEIANQYIRDFKISSQPVLYILTNFNVTTNQDIANVFSVGKYLIKVSNNQVSEFYDSNVTIDGETFPWVSRDPLTGKIVDKYRAFANGLEKYTQDPTADPVRTYVGGYDTIPESLRPALEDFPYKYSIQHWSVKSYGFIVEYRKQ